MSDETAPALLSDGRLAEIRKRADVATEPPWIVYVEGTERSVEAQAPVRFVAHLNSNMRSFREDAEFIAHARQDIPALLGHIDALTAERDALRTQVARLREALERYGEHHEDCSAACSHFDALRNLLPGSHCACGLLQTRAALAAAPEGGA